MMSRKFAFFLTLTFFFSTAASQAYQQPRLMFFMEGSCESEQKILHADEFVKKIQGKMDFETLDCNTLSLEEKTLLKEKYHLQDLPRLVLFDKCGVEIARYGFVGEKPEALSAHIVNVCLQVQDLERAAARIDDLNLPTVVLEELYKNAVSLKQDKSASIFLEKGVDQNSLFFLIEKYRLLSQAGCHKECYALRERVLSLDPSNSHEGQYNLALIDFQTLATLYPSKEAIRPLENYLTHFGDTDLKNRWRLEMMIAQFYLNYDEWEISLKHAETAFHQAPLDVKQEIGMCCDYITRQIAAQSDMKLGSQPESHLAERIN